MIRLQRALANPRASAAQIRAIAAELPTVGLEDALAILLALIDREPQTFGRRGAVGRAVHRRATRVTAGRAAGVGVVGGVAWPRRARGAEALIELSHRYGLRRVDDLLTAWLRARGLGE